MDFAETIRVLASRIPQQIEHLKTEEATKNALIMPFINALGYDVFDPTEIVPEFTADVGIRRGEKADYAILRDGKPIILFECKSAGTNLSDQHISQLFRYFTTTEARFGILTNGTNYRFHADLDAPNMMDTMPFMEFDIQEIDDFLLNELKRFTKGSFDVDAAIDAASQLKYAGQIKDILTQQLRSPPEAFVRFFAGQIYSGRMTQAALTRFTDLTRGALGQFISDQVYARLKTAMEVEDKIISGAAATERQPDSPQDQESPSVGQDSSEIITTVEEHQAYYIVKAILRDVIDVHRVVIRDVKAYCGILLDDNNRKPVCRLRFNSTQKYLGLFNGQREEERFPIENLDAIYGYADQLKATIAQYEQGAEASQD